MIDDDDDDDDGGGGGGTGVAVMIGSGGDDDDDRGAVMMMKYLTKAAMMHKLDGNSNSYKTKVSLEFIFGSLERLAFLQKALVPLKCLRSLGQLWFFLKAFFILLRRLALVTVTM